MEEPNLVLEDLHMDLLEKHHHDNMHFMASMLARVSPAYRVSVSYVCIITTTACSQWLLCLSQYTCAVLMSKMHFHAYRCQTCISTTVCIQCHGGCRGCVCVCVSVCLSVCCCCFLLFAFFVCLFVCLFWVSHKYWVAWCQEIHFCQQHTCTQWFALLLAWMSPSCYSYQCTYTMNGSFAGDFCRVDQSSGFHTCQSKLGFRLDVRMLHRVSFCAIQSQILCYMW